jgi:hypothetical protein
MFRGRRAGIAAALAVAATAAVAAGCGGGSTSGTLRLDPVAAAATKTQNAGAARVRFAMAIDHDGKPFRLRGTGAIDGSSAEMSVSLAQVYGVMGFPPGARDATTAQLQHATVKEIVLEENGDYVVYMRIPFFSSPLTGGKQWLKLDVTKLGKAAGIDLGQLTSGSQVDPTDLLTMLEAEGAKVQKLGPATIDGTATTHYNVKIDMAKALQSAGVKSPLLSGMASKVKTASENVWIGKDGLLRRLQLGYSVREETTTPSRLGMTMDLYDYGAKVSIAAPPSSAVFDATQLVQQGLGSMH